MKIWQKGNTESDDNSAFVEAFTVGNDRALDLRLAQYDVRASMAHAVMLCSIGIISQSELAELQHSFHSINAEINENRFVIEEGVEDVHSQIEKRLIEIVGDAGKKIHTGRSRNDQVLVAIKLFLKNELLQIVELVLQLFDQLQSLSEKHRSDLMPGFTHFQLAMPSSFGLWFGAYAESLVDDMELIASAYRIADKNPLGSGAGYGSAFPLDRKLTTSLLEFSDMNYNSMYAQMTRGKSEKAALVAVASVASTLSKLSYDVCLFLNKHFDFISFPDTMTTGSSIMPHKKNPDVFELIRAKCNRLQATPNEMTLLCNNLPSGYHRDMQLTKEIVFPAIDTIKECLSATIFSIRNIMVRNDILSDSRYDELFSVEEINKLVEAGIPFREAYLQVAESIRSGLFNPEKVINHTHAGSIGQLCNEDIKQSMMRTVAQIRGYSKSDV